jgi:hypothetical protein
VFPVRAARQCVQVDRVSVMRNLHLCLRVSTPPCCTQELRAFVIAQLALLREDHLRTVNPTPYKVSVSSELFHFIHELWMKEVPIAEIE